MSAVETTRLNREDFVSWLATSLSDRVVRPLRDSAGLEKPTDVVLAWADDAAAERPVICLPQSRMKDLLAFVFTYTDLRPFSAFFHVLPIDLISILQSKACNDTRRPALARCVTGAAMSEAWITSARTAGRPKNVFQLLTSSLSAALGQVVLAGYGEAALKWTLQEWIELRTAPGDILRQHSVEETIAPWRLLLPAGGEAPQPPSLEDDLIASFLSEALLRGSIQPEMLQLLAPLAKSLDLPALLASSREERINRFNDVIADLKLRGARGTGAEFLAGLMLAIAGNGSFELLRSAREFDGWLDGAVTWFGFCAALFEESNILSYATSSGRRLVRDISLIKDPFTPPIADIASTELKFLFDKDAISLIATHSPNSFKVEILPNVVSSVNDVVPDDAIRRRNRSEMLLQSLEEASYSIDRARQIALGPDGNGTEGLFVKPIRRRKR